jgi:ATP-dependent Clp protease ATP-binding subunit ClpB
MTSNIGSADILEGIQPDGSIAPEAKESVNMQLRRTFRPEFLNRIDDIIFFAPLTRDSIRKIIDLMLINLKEKVAQKELKLELSESAIESLMNQGYDVSYGARPMKRLIQSKVETLIARTIIEGNIEPESTLYVDIDTNGNFIVKIIEEK